MVLKKGTGQYFLILHPSSPLYFWRSEGGGKASSEIPNGVSRSGGRFGGGKDGAAFLRGRREEGGRGKGGKAACCVSFWDGRKEGKDLFLFLTLLG